MRGRGGRREGGREGGVRGRGGKHTAGNTAVYIGNFEMLLKIGHSET